MGTPTPPPVPVDINGNPIDGSKAPVSGSSEKVTAVDINGNPVGQATQPAKPKAPAKTPAKTTVKDPTAELLKQAGQKFAKDVPQAISIGQFLGKVISTPGAWGSGFWNEVAKLAMSKGSYSKPVENIGDALKTVPDVLGGGFANVGNLWADKQTVTGKDVNKTLGGSPVVVDVKPVVKGAVSAVPGIGQIAARALPEKMPTDILGLGLDILFDPTTFVGGEAVTGIKAVSGGIAKSGAKALELGVEAAKGNLPVVTGKAAKVLKTEERATGPATKVTNTPKSFAKTGFTEADANAGGELLRQRNPWLYGQQITLAPVEGGRSIGRAAADVAGSAAIGLWRGLMLGAGEVVTKAELKTIAKDIAKNAGKNVPASAAKNAGTSATAAVETAKETAVTKTQADEIFHVLDGAPKDAVEEAIIASRSPYDIKQATKSLEAANKVAKKTKVAIDNSGKTSTVMSLLNKIGKAPAVTAGEFNATNKLKTQLTNWDPLDVQFFIRDAAGEDLVLLQSLRDVQFSTASGIKTVGEVVDSIRRSKLVLGKMPSAEQAALRKAIAKALPEGKAPTSMSTAKAVADLVGAQAAADLKAVGAFEGVTTKNKKLIEEILSKLPAGEKAYNSAAEMISGIVSRDPIPASSLFDLLKALDPQHEIIAAGKKAAMNPDGIAALEGILVTKGASTIADIQLRINLLTPETMLNVETIPFSAAARAHADRAMAGIATEEPAILKETWDAAARNLDEYYNTPETADLIRETVDSLGNGLRPQFTSIVNEIDNAGADMVQNTFGRLTVVRTLEDGKVKAFLPEYFHEKLATKVLGSVVGKRSGLIDYVAKKARQKKMPAPVRTTTAFEDVADSFTALRTAVLSLFKVRITTVRAVKEAGRKAANEYTVFSDFGDFADIIVRAEKSGDPELQAWAASANKAFFPAESFSHLGPKAKKQFREDNSFSFQGVTRAQAKLIEAADKGIDYPESQLIEDILSHAEGQKEKWSPMFEAGSKEWAADIAKLLRRETQFLAERHTNRMLAEIEDTARIGQIMSADIFVPVMDAIRVGMNSGGLSLAQRADMVHDALMRFAIGSNLLAQEHGYIAMSQFRAASKIFMNLGGVEEAANIAVNAAEDMPRSLRFMKAASMRKPSGELANEFRELVDGINLYEFTRNHSAELLPYSDAGTVVKINEALVAAKSAYQELAKQLATPMLPEARALLMSDFKKAQKALDKARNRAAERGIPTESWSAIRAAQGLDGWVPSKHFDRAAEEAFIREAAEAAPVDESIIAAETRPLTKAEIKQNAKDRRKQNMDKMDSVHAQRAQEMERLLPQLEERYPGDELQQAEALIEFKDSYAYQGAQIVLDVPSTFLYSATYGDLKASAKGALNQESTSLAARIGNKFNKLGEKNLVGSRVNRATGTALNTASRVHTAVLHLAKEFEKRGITREEYLSAFRAAVARTPEAATTENAKQLSGYLNQIIGATVQKMREINIDLDFLGKMLNKHGLTPENGFVPIKNYKANPENIFNIFDDMPFTEAPKFPDTPAGKAAAKEWETRNEAYKAYIESRKARGKADNEFTAFVKTIDAIQFTLSQQALAMDLQKSFNYLADGISLETARARGYVTIASETGDGISLANFMGETAEEGNFFSRPIARSIAAHNREVNAMFNGKAFNTRLQAFQRVTQVLKTFQTVMAPWRHIPGILIGDVGIAILKGTLNPKHWVQATKLASKIAVRTAGADYRIFGGVEKGVEMAVGAIKGTGTRPVSETAKSQYKFAIGGKRVSISEDDLINQLIDNNLAPADAMVNDSAMIYQEMAARASGDQATSIIFKKLRTYFNKDRASLIYERTVKPFGDFTAYVGNIPRIAHFLHEASKRNWKSWDEMFGAGNDMVNMYHPTIQSLTNFESRTMRPMFTYYTWLRGATNATFDILVNHQQALNIPLKVFYNQATASGLNPTSPAAMWGDKKTTPDYMDGSVYGPTMNGERGGMLYRPQVMPMDILDTLDFQWDFSKSFDQNLIEKLPELGSLVGSNFNLTARPIIETVFQTNLDTHQTKKIDNFAAFIDQYVSMPGFMSLAKAAGWYTPYNKAQSKTNPLTQRDRDITALNQITGMRFADVRTPSSVKIGVQQERERLKRIAEMLSKQNEGK